jgi:hypothetical protein
MYVELDESTKT